LRRVRVSEQDQRQTDSPLVSERGSTIISDSVVSQIAGMAAQEVEGVHMGGSASRAAGSILSSITGSDSQTRGVSTEVGTVETAIDLTMGIEYGRNILQTVEKVRRRISERVQNMTGLRVTELNATINDIVFPEGGPERRIALRAGTSTETQPLPGKEREVTEASPPSEEETRAEGDETAELRSEDVDETRRISEEDEARRREES
jgi:uncharacterized alkaline shock family protein YloU